MERRPPRTQTAAWSPAPEEAATSAAAPNMMFIPASLSTPRSAGNATGQKRQTSPTGASTRRGRETTQNCPLAWWR